jgi:hypothetical protein
LGPDDSGETQSVKVEQALRKIFGDWNKIESNFQTVHQEIDSVAKTETKFRNSVTDVIGKMQDATRETDIRVQILQASLGGQVDDPEGGPMSIWEAIARLRTSGSRTTGISDGNFHYLDELRKKLPNWGTTLENMAASYIDTIPKINRNLVMMKTRIATLESGSSTMKNNPFNEIGVGVPPSNNMAPGSSYVLQSNYKILKDEIDAAFTSVNKSLLNQGGSGVVGVGVLDEKVDKTIQRLGEIEGRVTGESYSDGGFVFCSMTEVADWLEGQKVPSGGVFWDLFSVLVCMKPKQQTGKARADETYSSKRTNSTTLENDLLASMTHTCPEVLFAKKGGSELGKLEDGFSACSSYQMWITGGEAYKTVLTNLISKYCEGMLGAVDRMAPYRTLVMSLLTNVVAQWNDMCTFIDSFYIELTNVAGFSPDKAWKLVGRCCAALFSAMQPYRAPVTMLPDLGTLESKAACMWAVLQSHRVADAFKKVKYRDHPAVVKERSLFMLTERVDPSQVNSIGEKAKTAWSKAEEANAEVFKLKDVITTLKRDFANLKNDFASVKRTKT